MRSILLPGEPTSQKRPRIFAKGAMDPCWEAKQQHQSYIREKYPNLGCCITPLVLHLIFAYQYPKSMSKKKKVPHFKESRPDIDNLAKYVMDMANGLLWEDDSQVVRLQAHKIYLDKSFTMISFGEPNPQFIFNILAEIGTHEAI